MSDRSPRKKHVLIGATGSVASIKIPLLVEKLLENENIEIKVVCTRSALHFFDATKVENVLTEEDEWSAWKQMADPVLHIKLRDWADICVIAPLDANTLAKIANGLCDNLLTCILRAWDLARPVIVCPAMNTNMWNHPFTKKHLTILTEELGMEVIQPVSKTLACGDTGIGAMEDYLKIAQHILSKLESQTA